MNYAGVCTSVKIFVCVCVCMCVCVCACVKRERKRRGSERVHIYETFTSTNMYVYIVHCTQQCITFTHNLPDSNAMLLSGRVPGYKESDVKLLASSIIKHTTLSLGSSDHLDEGSGIPNLHSALAAA